ncbi:thioredoxin domain-containing protein [Facilibium subflavum]|uniref:thioredoxin domain-containing protein n=1 Tax=Facilibium subflavum TaxID=2219058 RepID=UPI000E6575BD|nr:thioredoxin domain-containing protein [Facilibium subflavum]
MKTSKKILFGAMATAMLSVALAGCSGSNGDQKSKDAQKDAGSAQVSTSNTASAKSPEATTDSESLLSKVSYTLGYSVGGNVVAQLKSQGATLDEAQLLAGFEAGSQGKDGKFDMQKMQQIMQNFQQQLMAKQQQKQVAAVLDNTKMLLNNPQTPVVGPKDAKVAVIEFFDYNCMFCSKIAPVMEKIMDNNPNVKYVFKEFPIFGKRWDSSQYGAEMGIATYMLKGSEGYLKYHNAVFATGDDEGKLTIEEIKKAAQNAGVDLDKAQTLIKAKKVTENIDQDMQLGLKELGIQGTPAIIVMPVSGANAQNTTVIPGYAPQSSIQSAIDKASK